MTLDPGGRKVKEGILRKKFPEPAGVRKCGKSEEGRVKDTFKDRSTGSSAEIRPRAWLEQGHT